MALQIYVWISIFVALHSFHIYETRLITIPQEIMAPQTEINEMFYQKPPPPEELIENAYRKEYEQERMELITEEELLATGGHLNLTEKEKQVNQIFMRHKLIELTNGMQNMERYAPALHFFKAKPLIENSKVFKFVKAMPKGALLHAHHTATVSSEWVIGNLTYMPGMLRCVTHSANQIFTFREASSEHQCRTRYIRVDMERARMRNVRQYDKYLHSRVNLFTSLPEIEYNTIDKVWTRFENIFKTLGNALTYIPAYKAFHWRLLEELYEDNVMYVELRMKFNQLYGDNGITTTPFETAALVLNITEEFKRSHPGFLGVKVIYSGRRNTEQTKLHKFLQDFKEFHKLYPDFIIGFDLVGQEDKGKALHTFVNTLKDLPKTAKYFFHAGETNWYGSAVDLNLVDAILMNTTRIGHGYALMKHPLLSKAVKERDIAIEVSPISNQVLHLVWDLRNHPGGYFMSDNIPMVITSDDPGFWNAKALSYDFYYAIMSFAPNNGGLKTLKNLVWNSIKYSALNETEKKNAYERLQIAWDDFIERVLRGEVV